MITAEKLIEQERELTYPGNQHFDPMSLRPYDGESVSRFQQARETMPELEAGGDTLLDIGSSKGLVCFHYRKAFKHIVGYEINDYLEFAEDVRRYHNIENITFVRGG
jgi:hypothetical protein